MPWGAGLVGGADGHGAEGPVDGAAQFMDEQPVHEPVVGELGVLQGEPDTVHGVVGEAARLGA
ncbi:hypothetical protein GCM10020256_62010 [Streptomyces thermocoprophilus]